MDKVGESELQLDRSFFLQMLEICGGCALLLTLVERDPGKFDVLANVPAYHTWLTLGVEHTLILELLLNVFECWFVG